MYIQNVCAYTSMVITGVADATATHYTALVFNYFDKLKGKHGCRTCVTMKPV